MGFEPRPDTTRKIIEIRLSRIGNFRKSSDLDLLGRNRPREIWHASYDASISLRAKVRDESGKARAWSPIDSAVSACDVGIDRGSRGEAAPALPAPRDLASAPV